MPFRFKTSTAFLLFFSLFFCQNTNAQSGLALGLNGVDGYMRVPDHDELDIEAGESFSITLWFRTDSDSDFFRIVSKRPGSAATHPGYEMITQSGGGAYGMNLRSVDNVNSGPPFGTTDVTDGAWHHLAMIVDGDNGTATIYVDGDAEQQSSDVAIGTQSFANNVDFLVGTEISENIFLPGFVDEIRLWSAPLSEAEIEADMAATVNGTEPNLIAAYDFEFVNDLTVTDLVGNHHGTLYGGATPLDPNMPMQFTAANLVQRDIPVGQGEMDEGIVAVNVQTTGNLSPLHLTNIDFTMEGTSDFEDVENVKIYFTGGSERFSPDDLFGMTASGSGSISVSGSQTLGEGNNHFWIAYDLSADAAEGNFMDAEVNAVTVDGVQHDLASPSEPGARLILLEHKLLFSGGDYNSVNWRIPAVTTAQDGSIVVLADARRDQPGDLPNHIDLVARRSEDKGETWSGPIVVADFGGTIGAGDAAIVNNRNTGDIIAIFPSHEGFFQSTPVNRIRTQMVRSTDNGLTWTDPMEITDMVNDPSWYAAFSSSGSMHQMRNGRIIAGMNVRPTSGNFPIYTHMIFSDDGGETWDFMENEATTTGNESKLVELDNGNLMFNIRNQTPDLRQIVISEDGGETWGAPYFQEELIDPYINGDLLRYTSILDGFDQSRLLFSIAAHPTDRRNLTIFLSYDEGETWPVSKVVNPGPAGYSSLTILEDGTIGCFYENGEHEAYQLYFARFSLDWLTDGNDAWSPAVGTEEQVLENLNIEISPNPTNGKAEISLDLEESKQVKAMLFDSTGKFVQLIFDQDFLAGENIQWIDLTELPSGNYYLQFEVDGAIATRKLVLSK